MDKGYDCQVTMGLGNTKENVLPICDKPYHTNKRNVQKGEEIEMLRTNTNLQGPTHLNGLYVKHN